MVTLILVVLFALVIFIAFRLLKNDNLDANHDGKVDANEVVSAAKEVVTEVKEEAVKTAEEVVQKVKKARKPKAPKAG